MIFSIKGFIFKTYLRVKQGGKFFLVVSMGFRIRFKKKKRVTETTTAAATTAETTTVRRGRSRGLELQEELSWGRVKKPLRVQNSPVTTVSD